MDAAAPAERVRDWLAALPDHQRAIVDRLRLLLASVAPEARESVCHGRLTYRVAQGGPEVISVAPVPGGAELAFLRGSALRDPHALLAGASKHARHLRLADAEVPASPAVRQLLEDAWCEGLARAFSTARNA